MFCTFKHKINWCGRQETWIIYYLMLCASFEFQKNSNISRIDALWHDIDCHIGRSSLSLACRLIAIEDKTRNHKPRCCFFFLFKQWHTRDTESITRPNDACFTHTPPSSLLLHHIQVCASQITQCLLIYWWTCFFFQYVLHFLSCICLLAWATRYFN